VSDSLLGSWGGETSVLSIKDQQMEDTELLAHTGKDTLTGVWSDGLLRMEWPGGRGLPSPFTLIPQDSPLLKLPRRVLLPMPLRRWVCPSMACSCLLRLSARSSRGVRWLLRRPG
jgi:hypothetical protein